MLFRDVMVGQIQAGSAEGEVARHEDGFVVVVEHKEIHLILAGDRFRRRARRQSAGCREEWVAKRTMACMTGQVCLV